MESLPPPHECKHNLQQELEVPDYLCGHLIYFDPDNGCHWSVYDGECVHKFPTRKAAERFIVQRTATASSELIDALLVAQYRTRQLSDALGRIFISTEPAITQQLTAMSVQLRAMSDTLDRICAYFCSRAEHIQRKQK